MKGLILLGLLYVPNFAGIDVTILLVRIRPAYQVALVRNQISRQVQLSLLFSLHINYAYYSHTLSFYSPSST